MALFSAGSLSVQYRSVTISHNPFIAAAIYEEQNDIHPDTAHSTAWFPLAKLPATVSSLTHRTGNRFTTKRSTSSGS